jgi:catechol 2,3-dioxygenase-like lactoylglutathione lyase family enzyme
MAIQLDQLDHLVLTVADIERTIAFYTVTLGMEKVAFGERRALRFGNQQINLHQRGHEFEPKAARPTPGSGDLCFLTGVSLAQVERDLEEAGVPIEVGPVERTGAAGELQSIYLRDPDGNLLEISNRRS